MTHLDRTVVLIALAIAAGPASALPVFYSTEIANVSNWSVAVNLPGNDGFANVDGDYSSFPVNGPFVPASECSNIPLTWGAPNSSARVNWIGASSTCSTSTDNQSLGDGQWTHYVFKQTFDVADADVPGLQLSFQWAADDSGQGFAIRGDWKPQWSLNSTAQVDLVPGVWPGDESYLLGPTVTVTGFKPGLNTMYFFVQGNGGTDGMTLRNPQFSNVSVPEPSSLALMGLGLLGVAAARRRALTSRAAQG